MQSLAVLAAFAMVATSVAFSPGLVATAADLITGKDIKDGTIKKVDLAPKVRQEAGRPWPRLVRPVRPARPGTREPRESRGSRDSRPAGRAREPGSPATADGPAIMMGRMNNPGAQTVCLIGPPSGLARHSGSRLR